MSTTNPYIQENENKNKKGGITPVIPGIQPQYDQPLRRPSSSSISSSTKPELQITEQEQQMPLGTQPFPQQQKEPMPIQSQQQPRQQWPSNLTPPTEQSTTWQTQEQQQPAISPPQPAHFSQESTSQPTLLTQQHQPPPSPTYEKQRDSLDGTHQPLPSSQQQQNNPPVETSSFLSQEQKEEPVPSPRTQQMKEKLQERYRLQPEPRNAYSPRQDHAQRYQDVSAEHLIENPGGDPTLDKIKSGFWKRAGQVQATLGDISGVESWQDQGRSTETWADTAYREAESRQRLGEASWINGEYNVIMGKLTSAIGYVAGDPEMQAKAQLRAREGQEEINRLKR